MMASPPYLRLTVLVLPPGKAEAGDSGGVRIGGDALAQQLDVGPEGVGAAVDVAVLVGGRVQGDLVSRLLGLPG